MNDHPFLQFINLVNFDQKIQSLENQKISVEHEIAALKKQEASNINDAAEARNKIVQLKKRVDEQELEMKILDQKEKDKKKHLENLADYKDYHAIKAEIENIQRLQIEQEKNVLDAWNQLESAQNSLKKKSDEYPQKLQEITENIKELENKYRALDNESSTMVAQRVAMEKGIPAEWLEKYTIMRARVSDPVVEIAHQSCGVCSQIVTMQDINRAKRGALIQCQTCYRLLYLPEIMTQHVQ